MIFRKIAMHNFTEKVFAESTKQEGWIPLLVFIACIISRNACDTKQTRHYIKYFRLYYLLIVICTPLARVGLLFLLLMPSAFHTVVLFSFHYI